MLETLVNAGSTLVAAFVGAWFAYRLTDRAHARQVADQNAVAANEAIFLVLRQYNMLKNVKDQLIDPAKDDPGRFINMHALLPLDHTTLSPHYERLAFLLESGDPKLLVDLMVENERFHAAAHAVNERSRLHVEVIQPLLVQAGAREGGQYPIQAIENALGPRYAPHLRRSTEDATMHVESTCESLLEFGARFAKGMKQMFPEENFIQFAAKVEPNKPCRRRAKTRAPDGRSWA